MNFNWLQFIGKLWPWSEVVKEEVESFLISALTLF